MAIIGIQPCDVAFIRSGKAVAPCSKTSEPWILAATILGSSMAYIDGTVVNVALPALQSNFNATVVDIQWIVESYALVLAALMLVGGSLGDYFGRRLVFAIGVGVFALSSIWCGLAATVDQLIVARTMQGVGGALLVPGSLAIISASFDEERRGPAIGTWSGFTAITTAFGPVLGGWLIEHVSWRAIFFLNTPIAIIVILISFWRVPESRSSDQRKGLDWQGAVLAVACLGGVIYGLIESSRLGFRHWATLSTLIGGCILFWVFIVVESRKRNAMLPLELFRSADFSGATLLTLFLYTALSGALFFFPLNLIQVQGYSATAAGAATLPFVLIIFALSRWSGGLVKRYGAKLPLVAGPVISSFGLLLFMGPGIGGSYWMTFFPAVVVLGLGMAVSVAPLTTTVMGSAPQVMAGIASGINNAVSRTSGALAIAVLGIVMLQTFSSRLDQRLDSLGVDRELRSLLDEQRVKLAGTEIPAGMSIETRAELERVVDESFVYGFRVVMVVAACLALLGALTSWLMIEGEANSRAEQAPPVGGRPSAQYEFLDRIRHRFFGRRGSPGDGLLAKLKH
ncbi:MAG: MFS transporter [Blastocatellia bacterium]|nr:MFS transporter [Blastocatellia bacterium]